MALFNAQSLARTFDSLELSVSDDLFPKLDRAYGEVSRHYHGRSHIVECLNHLERHRHLADQPAEIELAIWFHDAVYDTHRDDNEALSAQWAADSLQDAQARAPQIQRITEMIIATKSHNASDNDALLMIDLDLGILGTEPTVFDAYDTAIRAEYQWVPLAQYKSGRAKVLQSFLTRDFIYRIEPIRDLYEEQARRNLERALARLNT